jgi:molybdopterin synthase sulfur carrier subunit
LHAHLAARGGAWQALATTKNLRMAVNQEMAAPDTPLQWTATRSPSFRR